MKFLKNVWNKLKNPQGAWLVLFYMFFTLVVAGTIVLVIYMPKQTIWHYVMYVLSAVSLSYFVYTMVIFMPKMKSAIIRFLQKFKFTNSLLKDFGYRTLVFGFISLILNLLYISFVLVMAIMSKTAWYFTITVYYVILACMKANIFISKRKHETEIKQAKALRFSGIMFIVMTLAFSGVIVLIYKANHYFEYAGLLIYAVAAYTFYNLTISIINIFKARKHDDLHIQNIQNINLANSLISILMLQVALFQAFSPASNLGFANALTGAGVSAIILVMGILMIVKANKKLKELNNTK